MNKEIFKKPPLTQTISEIEKIFGKGSIMQMNSNKVEPIESISTGSLGLDIALSIGGLPKGRIVEIFGPESAGKTTLALHAIAEAQKSGGIVAFIDAENSLDINYAKNIGVDVDKMLISQPDSGENALNIANFLMQNNVVDLIVIDSVAALAPLAEINGEVGDSYVGIHARMMNQALRKQSYIVSKSNSILLYINQLREKVGITFGNNEVTPGGKGLKFFTSVRLDVRKTSELIKDNDQVIGVKTNVRIVKSKVCPPYKTVSFDILYGKGISKISEILDLAVSLNLIKKNGMWYSYNEQQIGQGREKAREFLMKNSDLANKLELTIRQYYNLNVSKGK
ncbi:recombinase RecA ['Crotalaria aegyptiaca' phytoplasma]|uniref:Protein RecA n=1 Tax=Candidatus Phytoplasma crotalariae TaxID=2982627 RepID=A0ABT9D4T9_9MOLU|nr:recombinase RecA ['Crotalaria aegyptiaca' phytoplasma]MDO8059030.1 recombinase RecA ['Crotalaria aegyptiaca' phytoplasma]